MTSLTHCKHINLCNATILCKFPLHNEIAEEWLFFLKKKKDKIRDMSMNHQIKQGMDYLYIYDEQGIKLPIRENVIHSQKHGSNS